MLLVMLGELPLLIKFFANLWERPQYDFYPLILAAAAYLAWDRLRDAPIPRPTAAGRRAGAALLAVALVLLLIALVLLVRLLGGVSAWLALAGCALWIGGYGLLRLLLPALVLLATIIPPPFQWDEQLALTLRKWAVFASGRVLDWMRVPHVVTGTLINIAGHRLGVESACSGIHSLMAVLAVTLMLGFWWRRPVWRIAALVACSVVFVMWANVLRIALGALLIIRWKIDILSGSAHELLGLVLFILCIALGASLDQLFILWRPDKPHDAPTPAAPSQANAALLPSPGTIGWSLGAAFILIGIFAQVRVGGLWKGSNLPTNATFNLPATLAGWQRVDGSEQVIGRPEVLGAYSSIWTFRNGSQSVLVAMDYPFPGYHQLGNCYMASGWSIATDQLYGQPSTAGPAGTFRELRLQRPSPAYADLFYSCCNEQGQWLSPQEWAQGQGLRWAVRFSYELAKSPQAYQVQVLGQGFEPITDQQRAQMRQLFLAARQEFAAQLVRQVGGRP
jgi:exosortase